MVKDCLNNLRNTLLTGEDFRIINNIYNINNSLNILSIDLGRNQKLNDMGIIDESQERSEFLNSSLGGKDKDKQSLTSNLFNNFNQSIQDRKNRKENLEKMESDFKIVHKEDNNELLTYIKDKIKIPNKSISIHDSFINLYFNRIKSAENENQISSSNKFSGVKHIPSLTVSRNYYQQEEELNNVEKFILNTKKLRYTLNIKEKREKERNLSYDSEGNIKNYFEVGLKLNPVFFDDIYDELQEQYNINNNMDKKLAQKEMIKEILRYYLHKKGVNLKFNDKISKKYLSMLLLKKSKVAKKQKKIKNIKLKKQKEESHLIEEISKKMHKKIHFKKRRILIDTQNQRKKEQIKKNNTEDNFWQKRNRYRLNDSEIKIKDINKIKNERQFTENNYLELETNSSEFSDIPSELDSEISEMIRKKQEREKNKNKDLDEGIYADNSGNKRKGSDFIISRPIDQKIKEKELEEEKDQPT